jgi:hypothetical protein
MAAQKEEKRLSTDLVSMLRPRFEGLTVTVGYSDRWRRPCVTFLWSGFAGLLPEERFHRLARAIPEEFRASRMTGVVWLELAPGETVEDYLKLPRSEDVLGREPDVYAELVRVGYFDRLQEALGRSPEARCGGDLSVTLSLLSSAEYPVDRIDQVKLVFIRHGAYCDCQVLQTARPTLAEVHAKRA